MLVLAYLSAPPPKKNDCIAFGMHTQIGSAYPRIIFTPEMVLTESVIVANHASSYEPLAWPSDSLQEWNQNYVTVIFLVPFPLEVATCMYFQRGGVINNQSGERAGNSLPNN